MNTAVKAADSGFLCRLFKTFETAWRQAIRHFYAVGIRKTISEVMGKNGGARRRDHRMAAQVFGKGRCLQKRLPLRINRIANSRFGTYAVTMVFFFPAANKGIHQTHRNGGKD